MNRVLAAERNSEAELIAARTQAEKQRIDSQVKAEMKRHEAEAYAESLRLTAQSDAEAMRVKTEAEIQALRDREQAAQAYRDHPALLRLRELETLRELARSANARIYIGFDKHMRLNGEEGGAD
jgi:regulator of protease activity HflC (stomatin/prohibitin superfamily)